MVVRSSEHAVCWTLAAIGVAAAWSIGMSSVRDESSGTRTVGIMLGCLEVPSAARVVMTESLIDAWLGYVDLPDKARVWWATGMWASWLEPTPDREVLWVKSGSAPGTRYGGVRQNEVETLVLDTGLVQFLLPGGAEKDVTLLTQVAGTHRNLKQGECARPEMQLATRAF